MRGGLVPRLRLRLGSAPPWYALRCLSSHAPRKPHYTTTPIFYVNAAPHVGHLHSAVLADVFSRWAQWRNCGWSEAPSEADGRASTATAVLATGTDEHGIKIQKVAEASGESARSLCDRVSLRFKDLAAQAGVGYSRFIRTTDEDHVAAVAHLWQQLVQRGFLYKGTHEGWYSVSDEAFYTPAQIRSSDDDAEQMVAIETGSVVEWSSEENYKFRLSAFEQPLLEWLDSHPKAVVPASRRDTLVDEIRQGLADLSVSRPRSRLHWGIPVPGDEQHTIYVWLDALTNYLTVAGYPWRQQAQSSCWPADVQVIGKDIIRFHAVYFPAFLLALELPLPKHIVAHGHWTMNKHKMSKSRGNVADPFEAIATYGRDELRWLLCRIGGNLGTDADWSEATLREYHRKHLQGQWGNLVSRVTAPKVLSRLFVSPSSSTRALLRPAFETEDMRLVETLEQLAVRVDTHMGRFEVNRALDCISEALARCNEHLQLLQPWVAASPTSVVERAVYLSLETCRISALLARPVLPTKMDELLHTIQDNGGQDWQDALHLRSSWNLGRAGKPTPLFPRLETVE